jgi:phage host-nuclease inhibitor protein Gam
MARIKPQKSERTINSWEEADAVLQEISVLRSQINQRIAAYNEREQVTRMNDVTIPNQPMEASLKDLETALEQFSMDNRAEFGKLKSKELTHGIVSFRTGMPKVVQLAKFTAKATLELIKQ